MGAWSVDPFGNDDAMEFVGVLSDVPDDRVPELVRAALSAVVGANGYLESHTVNAGVAAAALVCARLDEDVSVASRPVVEWLEKHPFPVSDELRVMAGDTLSRALHPHQNEWYHRWEDSQELSAVTSALDPYRRALGDAQSA